MIFWVIVALFPLPWTELTCWIYTEVRHCPGIIICLVNSSETKLVRSSKVFMFLLWIDISGSLIKVHYQFSQAIELKLVSIPLFWVTKPPTTSQDRRPHHQPILKILFLHFLKYHSPNFGFNLSIFPPSARCLASDAFLFVEKIQLTKIEIGSHFLWQMHFWEKCHFPSERDWYLEAHTQHDDYNNTKNTICCWKK